MPPQFLSCDWGTSSFRLRLVSTATLESLADVQNGCGAKSIFEQRRPAWARPDRFAEVLRESIREIASKISIENPPLVVSGMASSTIGWKELPYAKVPFSLDGSDLHVEPLEWDSPKEIGATYLVSGAATDCDMMRGEECQAIGILADPSLQRFRDRALLILPGTHSKHIFIDDGKITGFRTFMTGELFEVLSKHSVLAATVEQGHFDHLGGFIKGVKYVHQHGLAASLFKVRARGVLKGTKPFENGGFLSGVLIGSETADLIGNEDRRVLVVGKASLATLYNIALQPHRPKDKCISNIDKATVAAHRLILEIQSR
jgi:2-dehydro-3-deoxygalactonokinase